jgi:tetratricopeptide (TPR) repeat protein
MREFIDKERKAPERFTELKKLFEEGKIPEVKGECLSLIKEDPYYLEPYLLLHEIYELEGDLKSAESILKEALDKAEELIAVDGKYPDILSWEHPQNRHIINTLIAAGVFYWELGELDKALDLLSRVLRMNPKDEPGVRYYILAILEGMSLPEYEQVFLKEGDPDREDLRRWFEKNSPNHPEYFPPGDI